MDGATPDPRAWSRRRVLAAGAAAAGAIALGAVGSFVALEDRSGAPPRNAPEAGDARRRFRSRPDLSPPAILVGTATNGVAPGYIFFTPGNGQGTDGPMIVDGRGEPIWVAPPNDLSAANLRVATYRGSPVLTWWEGDVNGGYGFGEYVMADQAYRTVARIRAGNGSHADLHELQLTPEGSALITAVSGALGDAPRPAGEPTPAGSAGSARGSSAPSGTPSAEASSAGTAPLWQNVIQEIDAESGEVLLDWRATDHVDRTESYVAVPPAGGIHDFFHANSIDVDVDGNLVVSARNTSAVYKIERRTGDILWRMGGRRSDFAIADGARYSWQHDARQHADGLMTIFDDEAAPGRSRGLTLQVDESTRTVSLARQYVHPLGLLATSQGSMQLLPNGNVFVGWGAEPYFSEFGPDGTLLFDASFPAAKMSYRAFRFPWVGRPAERPALAVEALAGGAVHAFASWNGSTQVARWQLLAGERADDLRVIASVDRSGFETTIPAGTRARVYAARALDVEGSPLALSDATAIGGISPAPAATTGPTPS